MLKGERVVALRDTEKGCQLGWSALCLSWVIRVGWAMFVSGPLKLQLRKSEHALGTAALGHKQNWAHAVQSSPRCTPRVTHSHPNLLGGAAIVLNAPSFNHEDQGPRCCFHRRKLRSKRRKRWRNTDDCAPHNELSAVNHEAVSPFSIVSEHLLINPESALHRCVASAWSAAATSALPARTAIPCACSKARSVGRFVKLM